MNYKISHVSKIVTCKINLPASKSISNRLLIIQALCNNKFTINNLSDSDDTIALKKVVDCNPDVLGHNIETIPDLYKKNYLSG